MAAAPVPQPEVRYAVKDLLMRSPAFAKLPADTQQEIAYNMTQVADYLCAPEGIQGQKLPSAKSLAGGLAEEGTWQEHADQVNKIGGGFKAVAAQEGAAVAGALLRQVNFVDFVSGLIQGVFHAIVTASIEQMEAYGKLVASIAKSLNQFRDENVSENQGRDHLVEQFPDLFQLDTDGGGDEFFGGGGGGPRVKKRDDVDEDEALSRVNSSLPMEGGPLKSLDMDDEATEKKLVQAARTQLATSRQQLLATMVLMGINRIVVTDGKIQAKIIYDFQARDNTRRQRSAAAFDYARDKSGNVQTTLSGEGDYESKTEGGGTSGKEGTDSYEHHDANYYAKGTYKFANKPVMTAMSAASESSESSLQTKAQLQGVVDVNFKSDYFPLEKMADSFQIAQIQNASKPGRGVAPGTPAGGSQPPATTPATGTAPAPTTPATGTTTPPK